jgi:uncharacterized protein (DUF1501 family)
MSCSDDMSIGRRHLLGGAAASLALWGYAPRTSSAAGARDPRLLTIILRGGLDGLSLAAPVGDPNYQALRGRIAFQPAGSAQNAGLALDPMFVLNPAMPTLYALYQKREAMIVHAIATGYRGRSHFDGQDVLESGLAGVGRSDDGWMNRALANLPKSGGVETKGLAMGAVVPLIMKGQAPVLSWIPQIYNMELRSGTVARLMDLYRETDPSLAKAFSDGLGLEAIAKGGAMTVAAPQPGVPAVPPPPRPFREFVETAEAAARFLASPDGPRIGALSFGGWDTHANEGIVQGQLPNRLAGLDAALTAFIATIGPAWRDTVVMIVTEFGRTARVNGTDGTDHGTGMAAILLGGAINGGRVLTDWPGLTDAALFEGRDLTPTRDLRGIFKGVLTDHLGVPTGRAMDAIFPGSGTIAPAKDLLRSI